MTVNFKIQLDPRFKKKLVGRFEKYQFQVGILEDKPHTPPRPASQGLGSLQGGPVRKLKRSARSYQSVGNVSESLRKRYRLANGANFFSAPLRKKSKDMKVFLAAFQDLVTGKTRSYSKTETALRATIRNPILRRAYGSNTAATRARKTFNRLLIDTGQFFKAIKAKVRVRRV